MVSDAGLIVWHKLGEDTPANVDSVVFGNWFEDDSSGYFGESRWLWFASGAIEEGDLWFDIVDEFRTWKGTGYDKPTHWCIAPLWGKPE